MLVAVDTGLGNLLRQLPHHQGYIHQHTQAAKLSEIRPVPKCHNRPTMILVLDGTEPDGFINVCLDVSDSLTKAREVDELCIG